MIKLICFSILVSCIAVTGNQAYNTLNAYQEAQFNRLNSYIEALN